ncbi:MAG TPA: hypothetical protein VE596_04550 [Gaiellaceae bacterium]|jgi:hypothetical protein|nr:hypothetical protein [Gaiellaceae bacterium]
MKEKDTARTGVAGATDDPGLTREADERQTYREEDAGSDTDAAPEVPLFPTEEGERFRSRWTDIQTSFVDRPRESVEQADRLVADLLQRLTAQFGDERSRLEGQWDRGDDVSTEELRVALTRYRSFFERLLTA